jgi:hypothetical protein
MGATFEVLSFTWSLASQERASWSRVRLWTTILEPVIGHISGRGGSHLISG